MGGDEDADCSGSAWVIAADVCPCCKQERCCCCGFGCFQHGGSVDLDVVIVAVVVTVVVEHVLDAVVPRRGPTEWYVKGGPHGGPHRFRIPGIAGIGQEHDSRHSRGPRRAQQRAHVAGIRHPVENEPQWWWWWWWRAVVVCHGGHIRVVRTFVTVGTTL